MYLKMRCALLTPAGTVWFPAIQESPLSSETAKGADMKVVVNFDVCASTGACTQIAPEVFEVRSDGYLYVLQEHPGDDLREKVLAAADLCPTAAITVTD